MVKKTIFEYAILYTPPERVDAQGNEVPQSTVLVQDVTRLMARDATEATLLAAREIPNEYLSQMDRIEVAVRPF